MKIFINIPKELPLRMRIYMRTLMLFCEITGMSPDMDKIHKMYKKHLREDSLNK